MASYHSKTGPRSLPTAKDEGETPGEGKAEEPETKT